MTNQTSNTSDTEETNCPFCSQRVSRDHLNFEINENEQTVCILNLFDMFKHIEEQDEKIEEFTRLLKDLAFKN
ncbi:MAG: hypothetical protein ACRBBJ_08970 [Rhodomicrobiaceae bacterium]